MIPPVDLLDLLLPDRFGRRWLRNALDAVDEGLMDSSTLSELLLDLQAECAHLAPEGKGWNVALVNVCTDQSDRPGRSRRSYVLVGPTPPPSGHSANEWTTLVAGDTWINWHVEGNPKPVPWPSFPEGQDPASLLEFQTFVQRKGWCRVSTPSDGAWIGRPSDQGATCWVSTSELDDAVGAAIHETQGTSRQVAWALGLPHTPKKARVLYRIDAAALRAERRADGRRPTPADGPNSWFRTQVTGTRGQHFNRCGWGTTVNLDAIHQSLVDSDGRPEQVIRSVAVDSSSVVGVNCILSSSDDDSFQDPEDAFETALHGPREVSVVIAELRARVARL